MIDYFRAVAPARGYAIHDSILNDNGLGLFTRMPVPSRPKQRPRHPPRTRHQPGSVTPFAPSPTSLDRRRPVTHVR